MPLERLTRARLIAALNLLGSLAEQENLTLELCIYPQEVLSPRLREIVSGIIKKTAI